MKRRLADIRQLHREIAGITGKKDRNSFEYLDDFVAEISKLIVKLEISSDHMIWECISQKVSENLAVEDSYILRDFTRGENGDKYLRVPLSIEDFGEKFVNYFQSGTLEKIFEIPEKPGYSYCNLPIFSENEKIPQWILTLVYREEDINSVNDPDFFDFIEEFSHQIGLVWDKFQEKVAAKLLEKIDFQLAWGEKTKSHTTTHQLQIISRILAGELDVDWCAFFLVDEQEKNLGLEAGNTELGFQLDYSLSDQSNMIVNCYHKNEILRLLGRKNLEEIVTVEKIKPIEKAIRKEKKQRKFKQHKHHFIPYVLFEHALLLPIDFGNRRTGIITLFRARKSRELEPQDKFKYVARPFSGFETNLLQRVQRHVFNILVSHDAVQKRMRDIRNVIAQVINPISASISSTDKPNPGNALEKLHHANALSRIAIQYATNFEILLDIDTRKLKLKREKIPDLRKYLINFAWLYTPVIRPKCISINVTRQTADNICLEMDTDLFDVVISNIIDNAIKYSFDPEDRMKHGLQAKPASTEDKENVLITAMENENSVTLTVSSYGIEIKETEKEKVLDREFRGANAPDRAEGTGIGLYLAKEIIGRHGGNIALVPNTARHNTVFSILLPKRWTTTTG